MSLNPCSAEFVASLSAVLPKGCLRPAAQSYLEEPRGRYFAEPTTVAMPETVEQVSAILAACHAGKVGVVPYGGGTGLVGGQVFEGAPLPLILSLERMNAVRDVNAADNAICVEAGVILADVQIAAENADRLFPLSLASDGSCCIGGNLATNAGGVQVLAYGNARDLCLGLEAVLPDGSIYHGLKRLRKDNTGYDIKNLLIGSEGSLGVITAATLKLYPRPRETVTALAIVPDPQKAVALLLDMQAQMGPWLSAFELISGQGLRFLQEKMPHIRQPFAEVPEWMVLMEFGTGSETGLSTIVTDALATALENGQIKDVLIAQNQTQRNAFWTVRENIPEANRLIGAISSHDISVPISDIPGFIVQAEQALKGFDNIRINCFGHLGDGNLHYNVYPPKGHRKSDFHDFQKPIQELIHDLVHRFNGSFSAEHGVGRMKIEDLRRYGDPTKLSLMRAIKQALDPHGILNPGGVVP